MTFGDFKRSFPHQELFATAAGAAGFQLHKGKSLRKYVRLRICTLHTQHITDLNPNGSVYVLQRAKSAYGETIIGEAFLYTPESHIYSTEKTSNCSHNKMRRACIPFVQTASKGRNRRDYRPISCISYIVNALRHVRLCGSVLYSTVYRGYTVLPKVDLQHWFVAAFPRFNPCVKNKPGLRTSVPRFYFRSTPPHLRVQFSLFPKNASTLSFSSSTVPYRLYLSALRVFDGIVQFFLLLTKDKRIFNYTISSNHSLLRIQRYKEMEIVRIVRPTEALFSLTL